MTDTRYILPPCMIVSEYSSLHDLVLCSAITVQKGHSSLFKKPNGNVAEKMFRFNTRRMFIRASLAILYFTGGYEI
jgi:hypothetical protein